MSLCVHLIKWYLKVLKAYANKLLLLGEGSVFPEDLYPVENTVGPEVIPKISPL